MKQKKTKYSDLLKGKHLKLTRFPWLDPQFVCFPWLDPQFVSIFPKFFLFNSRIVFPLLKALAKTVGAQGKFSLNSTFFPKSVLVWIFVLAEEI